MSSRRGRTAPPEACLGCSRPQVVQQRGNKWTSIAAEYLPWRTPLDLRAACLHKTAAAFAANSYVQQGRSLAWLLDHASPDYQALWEWYRTAAQVGVLGATGSSHSSVPQSDRLCGWQQAAPHGALLLNTINRCCSKRSRGVQDA